MYNWDYRNREATASTVKINAIALWCSTCCMCISLWVKKLTPSLSISANCKEHLSSNRVSPENIHPTNTPSFLSTLNTWTHANSTVYMCVHMSPLMLITNALVLSISQWLVGWDKTHYLLLTEPSGDHWPNASYNEEGMILMENCSFKDKVLRYVAAIQRWNYVVITSVCLT